MSNDRNSGVIISGGSHVNGPVAGGRGARAIVGADAPSAALLADIHRLADEVRARVRDRVVVVDDPDAVTDDVDVVVDAVTERPPNPGRARRAATRISTALAGGGAAALGAQLLELVNQFTG